MENGYRDYCHTTIDVVLQIRSLLEAGIPVRLIRDVLSYLKESHNTDTPALLCHEFLDEVAHYRDRIAAQIATLEAQRSALDSYLREARRALTR